MLNVTGVRWLINGYEEWLGRENVPVATGLAIDPMTVETKLWPRMGVEAAVLHLDARGNFQNAYVLDIAPGKATERQRHLYEAVVYVLDGQGSTVIEHPDGGKRSFEWHRGSLFAVPVNMAYRIFNSSGQQRARLACVTNLPMLMKLFRNEKFIFDTPFDFTERFREEKFFRGDGTYIPVAEHRNQWESNFVPDLLTFDQMRISNGRGKGSTNIMFILADGTMHAHMSGIPVGGYKKSHRHREGFHIFQLSGAGYSLYWRNKDYASAGEEPIRVDWTYGLMHVPPAGVWHQHFNVAGEEARYMAINFGSLRYPFFEDDVKGMLRPSNLPNDGQIEYEDENPEIRRIFDAEVAKYRKNAVAV
jgi:mannose-6-phosphate isomerase-like protein (cupin superfamily)